MHCKSGVFIRFLKQRWGGHCGNDVKMSALRWLWNRKGVHGLHTWINLWSIKMLKLYYNSYLLERELYLSYLLHWPWPQLWWGTPHRTAYSSQWLSLGEWLHWGRAGPQKLPPPAATVWCPALLHDRRGVEVSSWTDRMHSHQPCGEIIIWISFFTNIHKPM